MAVAQRRMHDLGAFALLAAAPLLAGGFRSRRYSYTKSVRELRSWARDFPDLSETVSLMNIMRAFAWLALMVSTLLVYAGASVARTDGAPSGVTAFLEGVMIVFALLWTTCMGMMAMSVWRFGLSRAFDRLVAARLDFKTDPKLGLVGWLTLPNSVDLLPALLFTACFAPPVLP
ncbi:hypothetical protein BJ973_004344 [Actinoplanes tereljensis]|uniref:Uncharacterized protein n=1 Tax=Paractinoplanes tereljensis TaxID=571912 RepID=A0A919TUI9_9ACTN|nr:hypothetical protein [Actinoplanes tereljensis]GIF23733.1 hypothetical protein Ate02nite_64630 [Actinoplanes tereljensis]